MIAGMFTVSRVTSAPCDRYGKRCLRPEKSFSRHGIRVDSSRGVLLNRRWLGGTVEGESSRAGEVAAYTSNTDSLVGDPEVPTVNFPEVLITIATLMCVVLAGPAAEADELFDNPVFHPGPDDGTPEGWRFGFYGTDAESFYEPEGGHDGGGAVGVRSRGEGERGSWVQVIDLGEGRHLHMTGWYRTEDIDAEDAATVRVIWWRDDSDDRHIHSVHRRFSSSEEWTRFELLLPAPDDAVRAKVSLFNFFQPGIVWWSDVSATPAMASENEAVRRWAEEAERLEGEPATDGGNVLPNPSFQIQAGQPDAPDFWERGATGSEGYPVSSSAPPPDSVEMHYQTDRGRTGERSVAVECLSDAGRGAWVTQVPLIPGPWRFEAWYMTEGMDPEPRQGPVARISALDENGRVILYFYAYGSASEDDWSHLTLDFDAPPQTVRAEVQLRNAWATGTVHWDDTHLGTDVERRAQLEREQAEDERLLPDSGETLAQAREQV